MSNTFEFLYEFKKNEENEYSLNISLKNDSMFSLGGFTLRPSFFFLEGDQNSLEIETISSSKWDSICF